MQPIENLKVSTSIKSVNYTTIYGCVSDIILVSQYIAIFKIVQWYVLQHLWKKNPSYFISLKIDLYAKYCGHLIDDGPTNKIGHPGFRVMLFV